MRKFLATFIAAAAFAAPGQAAIVFTDNFDGENGGAYAGNYTGFANFDVTGQVDLVPDGFVGINCGSGGSCVDLDGSPGPGRLTSKSSFSFNAGSEVRLTFLLSGNQRDAADDYYEMGFSFGGDSITLLNKGGQLNGAEFNQGPDTNGGFGYGSTIRFDDPYQTRSVFFTAAEAGSLTFYIGTTSGDDFGPLLDNVVLDITPGNPVPEPATWAMMIAGFGFVGAAMRRRRAGVVFG